MSENLTNWRNNATAKQALANQGYYDLVAGTVQMSELRNSCLELFTKALVPALDDKLSLIEKQKSIKTKGFTATQMVDALIPGFADEVKLTDAEVAALEADPDDNFDLAEKAAAYTAVVGLIWNTVCNASLKGPVQEKLLDMGAVLIEQKKLAHADGKFDTKVATKDHDLINEHFTRPQGDKAQAQIIKITSDCMKVASKVPGIEPKMRGILANPFTAIVEKALGVSEVNLPALGLEKTKALTASTK